MTKRMQLLPFLLCLSLLPLPVAEVSSAFADSAPAARPAYREGELLVKFKAGASAVRVHAAAGGQRIGRFGRLEHVRLAAGRDVEGMRRWYASQPDVEYAEPNYIVHKTAVPSDTSFNLQWGMRNIGQTVNGITGTSGADINAAAAWDRHTGDGSVVVAVVDTGIDYNHPDLAANIWSNPAEIAGNGIDDDGNGRVDDSRGWDFANNDAAPLDDDVDGHGTHVAGIIGAVGNNAAGVSGVNWNVRLMPLKVLDAAGFGDTADIIAAIDYAIAEGARIINASYAFDCGVAPLQSERDALDRARVAGVLVVLAAGNDGCDSDVEPTYPASHALNNLLAVGASDPFDRLAQFTGSSSNFGAQSVHLFAPGKNVYSTIRIALGNYGYENGTSMAAPHVSGAAALLMSHRPALAMREVREILLKTAEAKAALDGLAVTGGRLNIGSAMDFVLATSTPMHPSHLVARKINDSRIDLSWLDDSTIETGWKLEYRADPGAAFSATPRATLGSATLLYQDVAVLAAEGTYNGYRIRAFNAIGDSLPTSEVKVVTPPLAPDALAASFSNGTTTLTWNDRSARENGYRVERASPGGLFTEVASLAANTVRYQDNGLAGGIEYRYRVRAQSAVAGFSAYTAIATVNAPAAITDSGGTQVGCFIATAAYGSALHPKVNALRQFRDGYLMTHAFGRAFVNAYYRASPPLADFIARHDWLRAGVRVLLWPLVWLAEAIVPDATAGSFFKPAEKSVVADAQVDKAAVEIVAERQLLVKFKPTVDEAAVRAALVEQGGSRIEPVSGQLYLAEFANPAKREQARIALSASPLVEYAEANRVASRPRTR